MAGVIGIGDVSSKDTGRGSQLKTGGMSRTYNTASKCRAGQVYSARLKKCISKSNNVLWSKLKETR